MGIEVGRYGIWARAAVLTPAVAARVEQLGYETLWVGGSPSGDLGLVEDLLAATSTLTVATGVVNVWATPAVQAAASYHRLAGRFGERFLLGVGVGHRERSEGYRAPYSTMVGYLDDLDAAGVPAGTRVLAALGPRMLGLAGARSLGAHPYLTTPAHTRQARALLGTGPLLAPEQKLVVTPAVGGDPDTARELARAAVRNPYLGLANYRRMLLDLGFAESDLDTAADGVVDALAPQGDAAQVAAVLDAHLAAGADHVCAQVLAADPTGYDASLVALAEALGLARRG